MGSLGLALPWNAKIPAVVHEPEKRLGAFDDPAPGGNLGAAAAQIADVRAEDAALASGCRSGDLRAYERLYTLHGTKMKNVARNLLGSVTDAEDAVQETFMKVQRSVASFRGQSSFVTWTYRILVNTCYDARRKQGRKREIPKDDDRGPVAPEHRAAGHHPSLRIALERALAELTRHQRDVFLLYEVEGFRHAEIAQMLEITETASKNTLFQAKKNLRQKLEPPSASSAAGSR